MPKRIQIKNIKGFRRPTDAVDVTNATEYGNPYDYRKIRQRLKCTEIQAREIAVAGYIRYLKRTERGQKLFRKVQNNLKDRNLFCYCPLSKPCHADVLLRVANGEKI